MFITVRSTLFFLVAFASVIAAGGFQTRKATHSIVSFDKTHLHGISFEPRTRSTDKKYPLVIFPNSWGVPIDIEYTTAQKILAKEGYVAFAYQTRGWFLSGGKIDVAGPNDLQDAQEIINYCIRTFPNVDPNQIAFVGISYGAGIAMLAGAKLPDVKAVVSMSGWMSMFESLDWNWSPAQIWGTLLNELGYITGRPSTDLRLLLKNLLTFNNMSDTLDWASERSVETFQDELERRNVPVMVANNMEDNLFHSSNELSWWQQYRGPKKLILSQGTHGEAEAPFLLAPLIKTVWNDVWVDTFKFLDYHLKGTQNGIMSKGLVKMQLQSGLFKKYLSFDEGVWPPKIGYEALKYTFGERKAGQRFGTLDIPTGTERTESVGATIHYTTHVKMTCGIPLLTAALAPFVPFRSNLNNVKKESELVFRSEPMRKDTVVCGSIRVEDLTVVSSTDRFQVYGYAYEEPMIGDSILLAHTARTEWVNATKNVPFTLDPMDFRVTCKNVPRSHRLVVGFNLHNLLYGPAAATSATNVTFFQDGTASVIFPVVSK